MKLWCATYLTFTFSFNVPRTKRGPSLWHAQLRSHSRNFAAVTTARMLAERNCSVCGSPMGLYAPSAAAWNIIPSTVVTPSSAVLAGTYHGRCTKLQAYLDEYCFRFNRRMTGNQIFLRLTRAVATSCGVLS